MTQLMESVAKLGHLCNAFSWLLVCLLHKFERFERFRAHNQIWDPLSLRLGHIMVYFSYLQRDFCCLTGMDWLCMAFKKLFLHTVMAPFPITQRAIYTGGLACSHLMTPVTTPEHLILAGRDSGDGVKYVQAVRLLVGFCWYVHFHNRLMSAKKVHLSLTVFTNFEEVWTRF